METERIGNMSIILIIGLLVFGFIASKVEMCKNVKGKDTFWITLLICLVIICAILDIANLISG